MNLKNLNKRSKKAQITIFIIIAVLIVVAILLFYFLMRQKNLETQRMLDPNSYVENCVKDYVEEAENLMLPNGGYIQPENYKLYQNNKVAYLCYNKNFYFPCINQEPVYIEHLEEEIKNYIKPKIDECFYSLKLELEERNYQIDTGELEIDAKVVPGRIEVNIDKKFELTKNEDMRKYDHFKIRKVSA